MLPLFIQLLLLAFGVLWLMLSARFLCALFSSRIRAQISRHRYLHLVGAALWILWFIFVLYPGGRPPDWWQRRAQRETVLQRVHSAGGWDVLRRDCHALAEQCKTEPSRQWHSAQRKDLPQAVASLQPWRVEYFAPKQDPRFNDSAFPVVRIMVFGARGSRVPRLGLDVVCGRSGTNYLPRRVRSENPLRYWRYKKVADEVYEFY